MNELKWTSEPPTQPGWYGLLELGNDEPNVYEVCWEDDSLTTLVVWDADYECYFPVHGYDSPLWCGPITLPELPDDAE